MGKTLRLWMVVQVLLMTAAIAVNAGQCAKQETTKVHHILLAYTKPVLKCPAKADVAYYLPYVAYIDKSFKPRDTMFDSFLFLPTTWNDRLSFENSEYPAGAADWQVYLDQIFDPTYQIASLDQTIDLLQKTGIHSGKTPVLVAIPYPSPHRRDFGDPAGLGRSLNFGDEKRGLADRKAAVKWCMDEILMRWKQRGYKHLELVGIYWFQETAPESDYDLIRYTAGLAHHNGLKLYWIPYYQAQGHNKWKEAGFDIVMMQPNLTFSQIPPEKYGEHLKSVADETHDFGMGMEIEMGSPMTNEVVRDKYHAYLDLGKSLGYQHDRILGYYQGVNQLNIAAFSRDPKIRELYDATYRFIKGK